MIELMISVVILGIIMTCFHQVLATALSTYNDTRARHDLTIQAQFAMQRMTMFVRVTDDIDVPDFETLKVSERLKDNYLNTDHTYKADGDLILDADNDMDLLVNEGGADSKEYITFFLNKDDPDNWKLKEEGPDYSTAAIDDKGLESVLCEHVTSFQVITPVAGVVEIHLALSDGKNQLQLKMWIKSINI